MERTEPILFKVYPNLKGKIPKVIKNLEGVEAVDAKDDTLFVTCESSVRSRVITNLEEAGLKIVDVKTIEPSLEEAFVKLISQDKGDA